MNCQTASSHSSPAVERWTLTTHDIDAYASGQNGWHLECDMLSGGSFAGFLDHVQLPACGWCARQPTARCASTAR